MSPTIDRQWKCWAAIASAVLLVSCGDSLSSNPTVPDSIMQVMQKPVYKNATWSMQVVDLDSGHVIYDLNSDAQMLVGSVRKLFSVGSALNQLGAQHQFVTPVYRQGTLDAGGTLTGNLILLASGDLTMGGRANPDGTIAITNFDHNEANSLGNAILATPDPLAGFNSLATQVAAAGIKKINGDVVIDDRLFEPFDFRGEFNVRPIFVNDDVVDVSLDQSAEGSAVPFDWRPRTAAFSVQSALATGSAASQLDIELAPELPLCIGSPGCIGNITGNVPAGFVPPLTNAYPLIRTFRVTEPSNYARTVFIEALARAGVSVTAAPVAANPVQLLPAKGSYSSATQVAQLTSQPYEQYVRYVMKVSYNIGADTSLMLFGLARDGSTTLSGALAAEQAELSTTFKIASNQYHFIDGSGGGDSTASGTAVIAMLRGMSTTQVFSPYFDALPVLGVDGSLATITAFESDATLAGAKGQVHAKTGTYVTENPNTPTLPFLRGQSLAGYIDAKSGHRIAFVLTVNNVPISGISDVLAVFQDEGTISAMLWKLQ
ncbi:D-alanyl-D-alanine carboxypeptidase/D-alanyl-D-alanine-endopeptidase [Paraburkholderia phytofirmans]|uniref:Peptidase S13 D-Ala-D-Ala carboxypeptidase C n=1 Tax=Paraburkholderia phytofirmans (strain DSM 17436 / LMG 22146 / PsJN) TaxID=398527 RepID=B2T8J3_PARPJ|nr:D-alanyl-D-alanine carboxypeptidase [Paraburkholderia phytofirmans]ACD20557.1 peptidase S13 D-Ala-D-Ala carboxypeptidase C [Paraburkholderia phytofirmans PsJN]